MPSPARTNTAHVQTVLNTLVEHTEPLQLLMCLKHAFAMAEVMAMKTDNGVSEQSLKYRALKHATQAAIDTTFPDNNRGGVHTAVR